MNATGLDVEVEDISDQTAGLALQGRLSREVLEEASGQDWSDVRYFRRRRTQIADVDVDVTRTGYTGDRGYELWMPVDGALAVWDRIFDVGQRYGIHPVGIRAMDVARVEAGLILIEVEYSSSHRAIAQEQHYSPFELGLGRLVDLQKASPFNGKRALLGGAGRRRPRAPPRRPGARVGRASKGCSPSTTWRRPSRRWCIATPCPSTRRASRWGAPPSITWGPTIKKMVGFGSVDKRFEQPGTRLSVEWSVEGERGKVAATVVPMPFLDLERKRS